ncbi:MAG: AAA family ATPase [Oliverpabstia sp.]
MKKPLAIGVEDYKRIVDKPYYYVDKTLFIKDLIDKGGTVSLFTRPRRFGKTLALSMLKTFFEAEIDQKGNKIDNSHYFDGMKIMAAGEAYTSYMGRYPVISLSLKSAKQPNYQMAYQCLIDEIVSAYEKHLYVLSGDALLPANKEKYRAIMEYRASEADYATSLKFLSNCLKKYHGRNVIILLDEYDVPLENAYFRGFYDQMTDFIRSLFESALKTNDSLEFAVITGCLRISKESIFTGLNNLQIISLLSNDYSEYFGFTQEEISDLLHYYLLEERQEELKKWYNGYRFGNTEVYNPWSVINYANDKVWNSALFPKPYWSNTSSNSIIRELIETADISAKKEIEELIAGGTIRKQIHEEITYTDIHISQDNLWNFLFFTGYLKMTNQSMEGNQIYLDLSIPNEEIRYIYQNTIREWFNQKIKSTDLTPMFQSMLRGDSEAFEDLLKKHLRESISYYDTKEAYYHGFLTGILSGLQDYEILSNREAGNGRPDILLKPYDERNPVVIIEIKFTDKFSSMEKKCEDALQQIENKAYAAGPLDEGYKTILKYGICFCKKSCMVKTAK